MDGNAYDAVFARVHQMLWADYAEVVGPRLACLARGPRVLDLCCGSGELAQVLATQGMVVTGVDASEGALALAAASGAAVRWVRADAATHVEPDAYDLVSCVSHSLQHLERTAIRRCFASTRRSLSRGGRFVFDLLTRRGLEGWKAVSIVEDERLLLIKRGVYDAAGGHAHRQLSGFVARSHDPSTYDRFDVVLTYPALVVDEVCAWLLEAGFSSVSLLDPRTLSPLEGEPEARRDLALLAEA